MLRASFNSPYRVLTVKTWIYHHWSLLGQTSIMAWEDLIFGYVAMVTPYVADIPTRPRCEAHMFLPLEYDDYSTRRFWICHAYQSV